MKKTLRLNGQSVSVEIIHQTEKMLHFKFEGEEFVFDLAARKLDQMTLSYNQRAHQVVFNQTSFVVDGIELEIDYPARSRTKGNLKTLGGMNSPMPGKILKILKSVGESVDVGDPIIVMEAMKMEHTIKADKSGKIEKLFYKEGDQVGARAELVKIG